MSIVSNNKQSEMRNLKKNYKEQKGQLRGERKGSLKEEIQSRYENREQREQLKNDYKEQKQEIKYKREISLTDAKGRVKNHLSGFIRAVLVGMLVLGQFGLIIYLSTVLTQYTLWFYIILEVFSFIVAVGLTNASKNSSFKIAWMSIALLLPVAGHVMYYLWGRQGRRRKQLEAGRNIVEKSYPYYFDNTSVSEKLEEIEPRAKKISRYISSEKTPLFTNTKMKYYSMGQDVFKDMFEDMMKAKKYIFVNFFIVAEGALWDMLHEILLMKVSEGVKVLFMYDDFGGMLRTDKDFAEKLNAEGIRTIVFNPIKRYTDKVIMNYRSHQKIVVIDGEIGYTGGINVADEYANLVTRFGVWKDCGIRLEGEGVWGLSMTFMQMWSMCCPDEEIPYMRYKTDRVFEKNDSFCHVLADGPIYSEDTLIESVYKQIISGADKYVYIMTPYLVLEEQMIVTIYEAVKRGVDVRIITPAIPDKKMVKLITNYNYGVLLKMGVKIYEYTPGFIHSKVIMNEFCGVVGTVNMDYRSFYLHYENAVWLCNDNALVQMYNDFEKTFEESKEYTLEEWLDRPLLHRIIQPLLNMFATLM